MCPSFNAVANIFAPSVLTKQSPKLMTSKFCNFGKTWNILILIHIDLYNTWYDSYSRHENHNLKQMFILMFYCDSEPEVFDVGIAFEEPEKFVNDRA